MTMIFVKPAPGGRIRQPERNFNVMPDDGDFVPRDAYYEILLLNGDVLQSEPPKKSGKSAKADKPAEDPKPAE